MSQLAGRILCSERLDGHKVRSARNVTIHSLLLFVDRSVKKDRLSIRMRSQQIYNEAEKQIIDYSNL